MRFPEVPVCCLSLRREENMQLRSTPNFHRSTRKQNSNTVLNKKSVERKSGRRPLTCQKNILNEDLHISVHEGNMQFRSTPDLIRSSRKQNRDTVLNKKSVESKRSRRPLTCQKNILNEDLHISVHEENMQLRSTSHFHRSSRKQNSDTVLNKKSVERKRSRRPLTCQKNILNEDRHISVHEENMQLRSTPDFHRSSSKQNSDTALNKKSGERKRSRRPLTCQKNILNEDPHISVVEVTQQMPKRTSVKRGLSRTLNKLNNSFVTSTPIRSSQREVQGCDIDEIIPINLRQILNKKSQLDPVLSKQTAISTENLSYVLRSRKKSLVETPHTLKSNDAKICGRKPVKDLNLLQENGCGSSSTEKNSVQKKRQGRLSKNKHKNEALAKYKTFLDIATIDDLALSASPYLKRKAKSDGFKVPCKNTLKRKRFLMNQMSSANDNYEDDMYESREFDYFKELFKDTSTDFDINIPSFMTTPQIGIRMTPIVRKRTPVYKDIISPREYALDRKIAEEIQYKKKRMKKSYTCSKVSQIIPEKKKLEFSQVLGNAAEKEKEINKIMDDSSIMEDSYFSDC